MKIFKSNKIVIFFILNFSLIIFYPKILTGELYEKSLLTGIKKENYKDNVLNNLEFYTLPESQELINKGILGKIDPFSLNNKNEELHKFGSIKLLGVYSARNKRYAILKYKEITGDISEGQIGGDDTYLLPDKVILKEITIDEPAIILQLNSKKFKISL